MGKSSNVAAVWMLKSEGVGHKMGPLEYKKQLLQLSCILAGRGRRWEPKMWSACSWDWSRGPQGALSLHGARSVLGYHRAVRWNRRGLGQFELSPTGQTTGHFDGAPCLCTLYWLHLNAQECVPLESKKMYILRSIWVLWTNSKICLCRATLLHNVETLSSRTWGCKVSG